MQMMFEEMHAMLPLRFKEATSRERLKLEWMRDYVNRAIEEHGLPETLKVSLPHSGEPYAEDQPNLTRP